MENFLTTEYVKDRIYELLLPVNKPIHLSTRPTLLPGSSAEPECIVINTLPIGRGVMQKCIVNVNYHVSDIAKGVPDSAKLQAVSDQIIGILKEYTSINVAPDPSYLIDIEGQETIREQNQVEHFSNLRFSFKLINNN